jgi:benzoyl-CoA 2,3-epoxidase subunit B
VGTSGIGRVIERTIELMMEHDTDDVSPHGGLPLPLLQKYINFHFSVSLDLFGSETSTNVANYFATGLKGRWAEASHEDDHRLTDQTTTVDALVDGDRPGTTDVASLLGLNTVLRREYVEDCRLGLSRWNRTLEGAGVDVALTLPHVAFNRAVGAFAAIHASPDGAVLSPAEWEARRQDWLPNDPDTTLVRSLMQPVLEPGRMAGWIAPPKRGIDGKPTDYEYVRLT